MSDGSPTELERMAERIALVLEADSSRASTEFEALRRHIWHVWNTLREIDHQVAEVRRSLEAEARNSFAPQHVVPN